MDRSSDLSGIVAMLSATAFFVVGDSFKAAGLSRPLGGLGSFVPLDLPFHPVLIFARSIEHTLNVSVQCPHEANARHHGGPVELDDQEQGFDRGLPLLDILFSLRQAGVM
ncbi:MAG TPA: hypothetical protein VNO32_11555 [Candidatus Acidoferrum sp.]|jgi:hypothetical protein|nr:hypothetical protein [Candidatus Acidoferrum sp.]